MPTANIGIFDSGIGGLTLAGAIHKILPNEALLYYGDTAHFPYGDKGAAIIANYSEDIAGYLLNNNAKCIIVACNTASANGLKSINEVATNKIPVIDVIQPVAKYIAGKYENKQIGVVATRGTITSNVYSKTIQHYSKNISVVSMATPLLAPLVEEGLENNNIKADIVNHYVKHADFAGISALVLGCTHYPLLKSYFQDAVGSSVEIIDAVEVVSKAVFDLFNTKNMANNQSEFSKSRFEVSDLTPYFQTIAPTFFSAPIRLSHNNIWQLM